MWAVPPCLCNCNEIMALWQHTDFQFFLLIPHTVRICVQALQRGNQASSFPRKGLRGFIITMNTLDVVSPMILILRSSQGTSVTALVARTYRPAGSNGASIATLGRIPWVLHFKACLIKLTRLLPKILLSTLDGMIPSFPIRLQSLKHNPLP